MKHKRTRACEITKEVRQAVAIRDRGRCIICGIPVPVSCSNSHFIKRSQGGLGIPENIVTMCPKCHYEYDFGQNTKLYEQLTENHLKNIYGANWDKSKLVYKKY